MRVAWGLMYGLAEHVPHIPKTTLATYSLSNAALAQSESRRSLAACGARFTEAHPRTRAVWNSVAFRQAFRDVDAAMYFHFPALLAGHPQLVYVPDVVALRNERAFTPLYRRYYAMQRQAVRTTKSHVMTISASERQAIIEANYAPPERVHVMRLGLDSPWTKRNGEKRHATSRIVEPSVSDFCLVPGRLSSRKNIELLLSTWAGRDFPRLVFVGPCEDDRLAAAIRNSPFAEYLGEVDAESLEWLFERSLFVLQASIAEGLGLPVAEALSRRKKIVCSALPSFEEITTHVSHGYWHFDPYSAHDIADKVAQAMDGPDVSSADASKLSEKYNWVNAARDVLQAFELVVGQ